MKKSLVLALVVSFVLSVAGTAFAFPVDFSGDFKYEFRQNKDFGTTPATKNENRFYTDLKFNGKIDDSTTFFGRFGGEVRDNQVGGSGSNTSGFTLDQFGVKSSVGNVNYVLGRQGTQLGQGGIFYAGSDIDPLTYFDGLVLSTKAGDFTITALGGKAITSNSFVQTTNLGNYSVGTLNAMGFPDQNWWGIDVKVPAGQFTLGAAYAGKSVSPSAWILGNLQDAKYWDLNFATKIADKVDFSGEYVRSDANRANSAYTFAATYPWDNDSFTVAYNNVQGNAVDPVNSNIGTLYYPNGKTFSVEGTAFGYKGFTYAYHHGVSKALGFNAYYLSLKPLEGTNTGHINNELGLNVKWSW